MKLRGRRWDLERVYKIIILVIVVIIVTVIIYNVENNSRVTVVEQEVKVDNLPEEFDGFTILQLADLHSKTFGENQIELIEIINNLNFDMIAITGDMENRQDPNSEPFINLLKGIDNKEEIFYTPGNHGPMVYTDEYSFNSFTESNRLNKNHNNEIVDRELTEVGIILKELGVKFLDEVHSIERGKEKLWVSELVYLDEFNELIESEYKEDNIKIAVTHYPMSKAVYEGSVGERLGEYDLIVSGHYHGGQWRIPYLGGLFIPDINGNGIFPSQERVSGLTEWGRFKQYVSTGIGAGGPIEMLRFRFFNKPEINLIKLVKAY